MTKNELNKIASYLSEAFVQSVCVRAGLSFQLANRSYDDLGLDGFIQKSKGSMPIGKQYQFQLKGTYGKTKFTEYPDKIRYELGEDFFDRMKENFETVLLIVIRFPVWDTNDLEKTADSWINISEENLKMFRCGYFKEIKYEEKKQYVEIPKTNLLTHKNLLDYIDKQNELVLKHILS